MAPGLGMDPDIQFFRRIHNPTQGYRLREPPKREVEGATKKQLRLMADILLNAAQIMLSDRRAPNVDSTGMACLIDATNDVCVANRAELMSHDIYGDIATAIEKYDAFRKYGKALISSLNIRQVYALVEEMQDLAGKLRAERERLLW